MPAPKDPTKIQVWKDRIRMANLGRKRSEETKRRVSESKMGEKNPSYGKRGELNPTFGKPRPQHVIDATRRANRGREGYWKGKHLSDEAKQKISEWHKGRPSPQRGRKRTEEQRQRISEGTKLTHPRGQNNPRWNGGRMRAKGGYIAVLKPGHPRACKNSYVLEHILIWEAFNGKPLPEGWVIHHLNGIKDDNRPSNLLGLPARKHHLILQAKAKRIQELEALLRGQGQLI